MPDDNFASLLRMQSLINSSTNGDGGGGGDALTMGDGGLLRPVNIGGGFSLQGKGMNFNAAFQMARQGKPGLLMSLLKALGLDAATIKKALDDINNAGAVHEASMGDVMGHGLGGGSFVSRLESGGQSGGIDI